MLISPDKRYTFADVLIWPEDAHIELIEGVPFQLPKTSPYPSGDMPKAGPFVVEIYGR